MADDYDEGNGMTKEALKQALEALEIAIGPDAHNYQKYLDARDAIKEALAQPEQEPVAVTYKEVADTMNTLWEGTLVQMQIAQKMANKKLYATPSAAQPAQEKCRVCGEGEATLMVIRECNKCGSEYAGKAEFDLAKAHPEQEPVAMRMPKVGDKVVCIEDESLGTVVSLTAGGSPDIVFDDGSHGTYLLREFAELFGYTTPLAAQPAYRAVKTYHEGKPWYVAQPTQEKCRVCGEGEATLMVIRECNKCGSEYAGKAEFDLAKAQPEQALVYGTQVSKVWWDGEKLMAKPIPLEDFYEPAPVQEPEYCDPSSIIYKLAERVMSDCGHSTNDQRLLDRIADRIKRHIDAVTPIEAQPAVAEPHKQEPVQDSTCNETLRGHGKAYPRTCKKCGLGPCIGKPKFDDDPTQRKPLTGEQIEFAWMKVKHSTPGTALPIHEFARAIEAKLKELNT